MTQETQTIRHPKNLSMNKLSKVSHRTKHKNYIDYFSAYSYNEH